MFGKLICLKGVGEPRLYRTASIKGKLLLLLLIFFIQNLLFQTFMTSINNSSAAKFLTLFCIPALILASGSFDIPVSIIF